MTKDLSLTQIISQPRLTNHVLDSKSVSDSYRINNYEAREERGGCDHKILPWSFRSKQKPSRHPRKTPEEEVSIVLVKF